MPQRTPAEPETHALVTEGDEPTWALLESELSAEEERVVEQSVAFLRQTALRHGIEHAIEVRDHVIGAYFDGDFAAFSDTRRNKSRSFAALCRHQGLPYKYTTLNFLVRIGQQVDELPPGLGRELTPTHHRALLPVADAETKARLARQAIDDELSVAALDELVKASKPKSSAGRKALPRLVKQGNAVRRALAGVKLPSKAEVARLDAAAKAELAKALGDARVRLDRLIEALSR